MQSLATGAPKSPEGKGKGKKEKGERSVFIPQRPTGFHISFSNYNGGKKKGGQAVAHMNLLA